MKVKREEVINLLDQNYDESNKIMKVMEEARGMHRAGQMSGIAFNAAMGILDNELEIVQANTRTLLKVLKGSTSLVG